MVPEKVLKEVRANLDAVITRRTKVGKSLWDAFLNLHPADIAHFLSHLPSEDFKNLLMALPQKTLCVVFPALSEGKQEKALSLLNDSNRASALSCLSIDEMTDLFAKLSHEDLNKYLELLRKKDREQVLTLLKFHADSAAGIMDTDVVALHQDFTVKQSIELIQRLGVKKDLYRQVYVISEERYLVGHIMLEDLVLNKPSVKISKFTKKNDLVAHAEEDQEKIANKMIHYGLMTVPVINKEKQFIGIIPSSTLAGVIGEEASEDVYRMSAMQPVKGAYFEVSFLKLLYQRSYILIALLLAQSLSSIIIQRNEALLEGFLVIFITMLISTGGNASSQTSAVIIQGMASGEINKNNLPRFFRREFLLAFAMSIVLGMTAFGRVYLTSHNFMGSLAVSFSLACIVLVAMTIGSTIPVILKRLKVDPAYSAGPVLATLMDILGLLIYCNVSKFFFLA